MNTFPDARQGFDEEDLPLRPATPGGGGGSADEGSDLLPPFAPGRHLPESPSPGLPEGAGSVDEGAEEELPWLAGSTAEEAEQRRQDEESGEPVAEAPAWLDLGSDFEGGGIPEEPLAGEPAETPEAAGPDAAAAAADALAERFESIARMLRARGVAGVLDSRARDPLGLLLTGFALGYLQRDEDAGE